MIRVKNRHNKFASGSKSSNIFIKMLLHCWVQRSSRALTLGFERLKNSINSSIVVFEIQHFDHLDGMNGDQLLAINMSEIN